MTTMADLFVGRLCHFDFGAGRDPFKARLRRASLRPSATPRVPGSLSGAIWQWPKPTGKWARVPLDAKATEVIDLQNEKRRRQ